MLPLRSSRRQPLLPPLLLLLLLTAAVAAAAAKAAAAAATPARALHARRLAEAAPVTPLFDGTWETVGKQVTIPDPFKPGIKQPSVRYSSTTVPWGDEMIMTHGYFYNRNQKPSRPAWLHDTWSFSYTSNKWTLLNDGKGVAPSPRYGHVVCVHDDAMYFFGGDDGDHIKSPTNYRSNHFDDLWRFDLKAKTWSQVTPTDAGAPWPPPRSLHAGGLIGDEFVIFGGLGRNDTWGFNLRTQAWREFHPTTGPGIRYAQSSATADGKLFVFGGARRGGKPFDDFWAFDPAVKGGEWVPLAPAERERAKQVVVKAWPPGRSYGSLNTFHNPVAATSSLALFGGANCTRGCKCKGDTWLWDMQAQKFTLVVVEEGTEPVPRCEQSRAVSLTTHPTNYRSSRVSVPSDLTMPFHAMRCDVMQTASRCRSTRITFMSLEGNPTSHTCTITRSRS